MQLPSSETPAEAVAQVGRWEQSIAFPQGACGMAASCTAGGHGARAPFVHSHLLVCGAQLGTGTFQKREK